MSGTALVLGGGGVKGLTHVGGWKAIEETGLAIDRIYGTSIGALVGACIAGGMGWEQLAPLALGLTKADIVAVNRWAVLFNGIRQPAVFTQEPFHSYIRSVLPVRTFDELKRPFTANAVNLETGKTVWFGEGGRTDVPLADAVYASCALPIFYPPIQIGDHFFVDGGVGDTLVVRRAAEEGAARIIAIDCSAGEVKDSLDIVSKGMVAIHHRVGDIMAYRRRLEILESWNGPPLCHVRPRLDGYSTFDFAHTNYFVEEGYRATKQALVQTNWVSQPARTRAGGAQ